jgi:putative transposase
MPKHSLEPSAAYFITSVTYNRQPFFQDHTASRLLLITLQYYKYYLDYRLYAFVIMPDHFHMLLQPAHEYPLPTIMNKVKGNFSNKYNRLKGRQGTVWQAGYYDEGIRDYQGLIKRIEYIHNNPVRAQLTTSPDQYEFSSYGYYYGSPVNYLIDYPEV